MGLPTALVYKFLTTAALPALAALAALIVRRSLGFAALLLAALLTILIAVLRTLIGFVFLVWLLATLLGLRFIR